jgi:hypothetical protein
MSDENEAEIEKARIEQEIKMRRRLARSSKPATEEETPKQQKWKANEN